MDAELAKRLRRRGFVTAGDGVPSSRIYYGVRRGKLVKLHPGVFADAERVDEPGVRVAAALAYAGPEAARSHLTGLGAWQLVDEPATLPVHISVPYNRGLQSSTGLVVHRRVAALDVVVRDGLRTLKLERCLVDSWGLHGDPQGRAHVIEAVRRRLTTVARVRAVVEATTNLVDRASLLQLLNLLDAGCHSEFEIWGFTHVFDDPRLPSSEAQLPIRAGNRVYYLDRAFRRHMVAVELDGAEHHTSPRDRERDLCRDAALAAMGWVTVRFTPTRLRSDTEGARQELLRILAVREQQFRLAS